MKLKRIGVVLILIAGVLSGGLTAAPYFVRQAVIHAVKNAVPGSEVAVENCVFTGGNNIVLRSIRLSLNTPSKNFPRLALPKSGNGLLSAFLASVTVSDLRLDIQTSDLAMNGTLSFTRDLRKQTFQDLALEISSLSIGPVQAKNIHASTDSAGSGAFGIENILFSKFSAERLAGRFRLSDAGVLLENMSADFLNGTAKGRLTLTRLGETPVCTAELDLADIPVASFLKLWEWEKKVAADGLLRGHLIAEAAGGKLTRLDGAMLAVSGGNLLILDQAFLENIAARSKQPIEIVKASFEDYHYNTGTVGVSLEQNSLRLRLDLEGEKGKRDLEVTLHDWF